MKEVVVYESSDGIKFCSKKHCMGYERVLKKIKQIESLIPLQKNIVADSDYVVHKVANVIKAKQMYQELVSKAISDYIEWAEANGHFIKSRNESDKSLQDEGIQYFTCLAERFERIDNRGREFKYKELTNHPNGLKGFRRIRTK